MFRNLWVGAALLLGLILLSFPALAYPDFSLSVAPASISLCPCATIGSFTDQGGGINILIKNEGDVADTYELSLGLPGEDWSGFIYNSRGEITLGPNEGKTIEPVWITAGCSVKPGTYTIKIAAKSRTYGEEKTKALRLEILKCHQVGLQLPRSGETCMETPIELEMNITNYGKYEERFSPEAGVNWARFSSDTVSVKSGETRSLVMALEPPAGMKGTGNISVSVKSLDSYAEDSETLLLDVQDCYSFQASLEPASQSVCRGKSTNYVLRISNTGSMGDSYSIFAPEWVTPEAGNVALSPGKSRDVVLAANAIGTGEFRFNVTVISSKYPLYPGLKRVVGGVADARECRGVAVVVSPPRSEICSAEEAEYMVTVKNIGTVSSAFSLESSLGELEQDKLVLEPGESGNIRLAVGPGAAPGNRTVRVRAESEGVYDEDEAGLLVENCYSAGITIRPLNATACPCLSAVFEAELKNTGKLPDAYAFSLTSTGNMSGADFEEALGLLPGESEGFRLEVPIPCDAGAGAYKVTAKAESENTMEMQEAGLAVREMGECYSIALSAERDSLETVAGKAAVFAVSAENRGRVEDTYRLILVGPEWSYLSAGGLSLRPGESRIVYVYASPAYGSELKEYELGLAAVSDYSTARIALSLGVVKNMTGAAHPQENMTPPGPPGNVTPAGNATPNITANVTANVSIPTGQIIGEGVALSWKIIAVSLIALAIVVILVTRFVVLIR